MNHLVTRHEGARDWIRRQGVDAVWHERVDDGLLAALGPGDVVIGSLPVHLAAAVGRTGARYLHLSLDPGAPSGELSADEMEAAGARLVPLRVLPDGADRAAGDPPRRVLADDRGALPPRLRRLALFAAAFAGLAAVGFLLKTTYLNVRRAFAANDTDVALRIAGLAFLSFLGALAVSHVMWRQRNAVLSTPVGNWPTWPIENRPTPR